MQPLLQSLRYGRCRTVNKKINRVHERALIIVYQDDTSTFGELLNKDNSVKIHTRNLDFGY